MKYYSDVWYIILLINKYQPKLHNMLCSLNCLKIILYINYYNSYYTICIVRCQNILHSPLLLYIRIKIN